MILETNSLTKRYGSVLAADSISISVEKGMAFGILGPNGSGKTTTLGIVLSVIKADGGSFKWFGENSSSSVNKQIGSLLEVPNFFPYLSLTRNLEVIARIREVALSDIDRVLDLTGLLGRRTSRFDTLSLGMKQRMALAATLLGNPSVLVLDEPANGLDPEGIAEVRNIILNQREENKTIIMASHILDEVEKVCTNVVVLKKGRTIASGKVDELLLMDSIVIAVSNNNGKLMEAIELAGLAKQISIHGDHVEVVLNQGVEASRINSLAYENGVLLSELSVKKNSLEDQFLELVKNER
jgi:ABC-2 type transport system ATP-binding protein